MSVIKFGTDGWRAVIAKDFTFDNVALISAGIAKYIKNESPDNLKLVVGCDRRFLSKEFAEEVAMVNAAAGITVYLADDYAATPAISFAAKDQNSAGAVMITASHNPVFTMV